MRDDSGRWEALLTRRPRLIRLSYFLWVPIVGLLYTGYASHGLPYVLWSYRFELHGSSNLWDYSARHYTQCTFGGTEGSFTRPATDGRCPWIAFRRANDGGGAQ